MKETTIRLVRLAGPFKRWMALGILLGFSTTGSGIGLLMTSAYLIARAALHPSIAELQVAIVGVRFFGIARGILRYLERLISHEATFRLLARVRVWFYEALEPLAPARLASFRSGDLLGRSVTDVEDLQNFYIRVLHPPVVAALVAGLMWVLLSPFDVRLAVVLTLFLTAAGIGAPLLTARWSRRLGQGLVNVRADLQALLVDQVQGMGDLLAMGQAEPYREKIFARNAELVDLQGRLSRISAFHESLTGLSMDMAVVTSLVLAVPQVSSGSMDGIYLPVVVMGIMAAFEAVRPLPEAFTHLEEQLTAARWLFEIVDAEPEVQDRNRLKIALKGGELQLEGVHFAYEPDSRQQVLRGVSLVVPEGGHVAVVGPSGAGKSTLVNLLLRFWDYQQGRILLGGRELRDYPQEQVRRSLAVVSQRTHLFAGTIRDNLLLARPGAGEEELIEACRCACLHEFIQELPAGYDTWIGEQGLQLSGGERQRLALARALLQKAPILLLDEATAHLDARTAAQLHQTLASFTASLTVLTITHQLTGLGNMDRIYVLYKGRIVEEGTHLDLWRKPDGYYRRLWDLQFQEEAVGATSDGHQHRPAGLRESDAPPFACGDRCSAGESEP